MADRQIDIVPLLLEPEVLAEIEARAPGVLEVLRTSESEEARTAAGAMLFFAGYRNGVDSTEPKEPAIQPSSNGHKSRKK